MHAVLWATELPEQPLHDPWDTAEIVQSLGAHAKEPLKDPSLQARVELPVRVYPLLQAAVQLYPW